ncbi:biopolymer transporter ExbD [uncultured Hymenobacter sp.]|uniref:biopolymer transporter ExbD n=1 Tax=uncultured Hymenobacter sp. TaxID=170016 RepID=UPI0035C9D53A
MVSILTQPRRRQIHRRNLSIPEVWPLAIVVVVLFRCCLAITPLKHMGPDVDLPTSSGITCLPDMRRYVITISKDNKLFFDVEDELYRTIVIEQVALLHSIRFTLPQQQELHRLPYLAIDMRRLPEYFSSSRTQRYALLETGIPAEQLEEYIDATRRVYLERAGLQSFCFIQADKKTPFANVRPIIQLLQKRNINRFYLRTTREER